MSIGREAGSMSERYEIAGPFQTHRVIVDGRRVPFLEALPMNGGKISLLLDSRYALDISVADAELFIPWIADAIAVAMGYTCHPRRGKEPMRSSPFPPDHSIGWMESDPAGSAAGG
ncbi:MAG TPA: hypothetical protein VGH27_08155 [Streptosporangiaceae bacterium]|jgi:hypothetical protein